MPTSVAPNQRPASLKRVVAATLLGATLVVGLTALYSWQDYRETAARAEERARLLATVLEGYATRTLNETEAAMTAAAELHAGHPAENDVLLRYINLQRKRFPYLVALHVLDASGTSSGDGDAAASQALLAWARMPSSASDQVMIGDPLMAGAGVPRVIPLITRVSVVSGSPPVTVAAAIRADFLSPLHTNLGLSPDTLSVLLNRKGVIVARAPYLDRAIGFDTSGTALYRSAPAGQQFGVAIGNSPIDGITRLMGFSRMSAYPLTASTGFDHAQMLAPWRTRAWRDLIVALSLLAIIVLLGHLGSTRAKGEEAARRELRDSEEHHRTAMATLAEGVVTHGPDGAIRTWNDAALRILCLTADQLRGRTSLDPRWRAVHEDGSDFPGAEHPAMRALATGDPQLDIVMGIDAGGAARRWLEVNAVPTRSGGAVDGVVASFIDITERLAATQEIHRLNYALEERVATRTEALRRTSLELEELVYSMAHTLRAPLRHMSAFSSLLAEDAHARLTTDDQHLISRIREGAERQARLLDEILKYTGGHEHVPSFAHIAMDEMVDTVIPEIAGRMPEATRVDWIRTPLPRLYGDPAMVADILEILLSNAVKFSARSAAPRIEIGACEIDGNPGIQVRDNGVGFDMIYAGKLFGMFQRLHETEGFEGAGMSLAVCKRLLERLGGSVSAEGRVGYGATFRFTLGPARPGAAPPLLPEDQARAAAT